MLALTIACLASFPVADSKAPFVLNDGDRIVYYGNTFLERDRHYGRIETMLRSRFPGVRFSVRNLAWPGDTTAVQLRPLNFGSMERHVKHEKPTVVFVSFGMSESFHGPDGLERYLTGYRKQLDMLQETKARIVMLSPIRHENLGPPLPDPAEHNAYLKEFVEATRKLANEHGCDFVDLFTSMPEEPPGEPLTENGIHLTSEGYAHVAEVIGEQLGLKTGEPTAEFAESAEKIQREIIRKDQLFFNRWRAHNGEYIYGRRAKISDGYKDGRGNSGNPSIPMEMAEVERMLREADERIAELSRTEGAE